MFRRLQALAILMIVAGFIRAQERANAATPPVETALLTSAPLFTISWNLTNNYVQYDAKLKGGRFDPKEPIRAYWIMKQTDGHRENLTMIERMKGYGFSIHPGSEPDSYDLVVVSVKKKTLHVTHTGDQFDITLSLGNCQVAHLKEARVQAHWWHFVAVGDYVDLAGTDAKTGEECHERVAHE